MLRAAPEPLPSLTTFVYPHGGIGALANTFRPFDKVVGYEPRELQQAPRYAELSRTARGIRQPSGHIREH